MSSATQSQSNVSFGLRVLERVASSTTTTIPCCIFLFINSIMLFTLRSNVAFRETSCYILLYNLLFADTVQMVLSQVLCILSVCRITLTYPVCGLFVMLAYLTNQVTPLTLVVMSLERYVAVCYPLRHATIITIRNSAVAIILVWAIGSLNVLTQVKFSDQESLQMTTPCRTLVKFLSPVPDLYDNAYTCFLFVSAGVAVTSSYIVVMIAARSASTDKASAHKARKTLLLHLVQFGLSLLSTIRNPLLSSVSKIVSSIVLMRIRILLYVCFNLLPRCLSALIYGLRDQTIRHALMYYLYC